MDKQTAKKELDHIQSQIDGIENQKKAEILEFTKTNIEPLKKKIEDLKKEIESFTYNRYKDVMSELFNQKQKAKAVLDSFNIEEAKELWYAKGTKVYLWKQINSWAKTNWEKTSQIGIVDIYDGSQELPSIQSFRLPKKGDVIVRHLKKDGSFGLKFDLISDYGSLRYSFPMWCSEEDSPSNNPVTRKKE